MIFSLPSLAVLLSRKRMSGAPHGIFHPGATVQVIRKEKNRKKGNVHKVDEMREKNMKATETKQLKQPKKDRRGKPAP